MKKILLLIWAIGYVITFIWITYKNIKEDNRLTLSTLVISLSMSLFSWIGVLGLIIETYGDVVIWEKKYGNESE